MRYWHAILFIIILVTGCKNRPDRKGLQRLSENQLFAWNQKLTQVFISDVLSPPVCSRGYAYANIAAYEAFRQGYTGYPTYAGRLNGFQKVPEPKGPREDYNFSVAGIIAFITAGKKMTFNSDAVTDMENTFLHELDSVGIDEQVLENSISFGRAVGQHVIQWAASDGYLQRNARPAYLVTKEYGRWQPTPPDYMDAIEPNWHTLRSFTFDSVSQFRPGPPVHIDTTRDSPYFKDILQVYNAVSKAEKEHVEIAKFWDCNPNISVTQGHVMFFQQKISPGGHWISIAGSVCKKEGYNEMKTAEVISKVAIAIADGFISCWDAKYHYNTIRPETVINRYIDKDWKPLLQTPPFPEYPSGHSVVSGAASTVLTALVGDNYGYIDSTELPFGMPARRFTSFTQAALEASISRMYGGIHYLPSLNTGMQEGTRIGTHILTMLNKPDESPDRKLRQAGAGD